MPVLDRPAVPVMQAALPDAEELEQFHGLWVAVVDGQVVASGKTVRQALKSAEAKGYESPTVFHAPFRREGRAYY
jgi:Family of unknown function (DUF5678)